jgi:hypothetical protein
MKIRFTNADCQQMEALGIEPSDVFRQIGIFRRSNFSARLNRPCTLGDGVWKIDAADAEKYLDLHRGAASRGRFMKLVPASGAATRMFQSLLQIYYLPQFLEKDELLKKVEQGVAVACDFVRFMEGLRKFAFVDDLIASLAQDGLDLDEIVSGCQYRLLLDYLLTDRGLGYGVLPKALLKFHAYPEQKESRTAFEEQLVESVTYLGAEGGKCRLHFTIPVEFENGFKTLMERVGRFYEDRYCTAFEVSFSFQKPSTHTVAADMEGLPFRDRFGRLHFRPAGHGALLENLNDLQADIVYIKNIDNIVPDRFKEPVVYWKRILGGYLVSIQQAIHSFVRRIRQPDSGDAMREAAAFAARRLHLDFPDGFENWSDDNRRNFLLDRLDRPIRVCGVVPNAGEPGGAPFWVEDENGLSVQIVEKAQVDFGTIEQREIWNASTHFNPVDIVCGTRDFAGKPYDLRKFVDPNAVIITKKSKDGKDIQALELPGLWNGSMARWITVIVEVPPATFNPVKSVYDLLRPEHQPEIPSRTIS